MSYDKEYYEKTKDKAAERQRRYKRKHKDKINMKQQLYREQLSKEKTREYRKNQYRIKREFIDSFKTKCNRCGFSDKRALVFHHINPEQKDFQISQMINKCGIERLKKEIEKCEVICSNCHLIEHHPNQDSQ